MSAAYAWLKGKAKLMKYNTVQIVAIQSPSLSLIFRITQIGIAIYIILSVIVLKHGYQKFEPIAGTTVIKAKGSAINTGGTPWANQLAIPGDITQYYDATDLVYPATERDAIFLTTNLHITPNQTRGECYPGDPTYFTTQPYIATADADCAATCQRGTIVNEADKNSGGVYNGQYQLRNSSAAWAAGKLNCFCKLYAWCPDEALPPSGSNSSVLFNLTGQDSWTISFRQNVEFKIFGVVTTNLEPKDALVPPIFSINQILSGAGLSFEGIRQKGAVVVMNSVWDCDLDYSIDQCDPTTTFANLGQTYNFRRTIYFDGGLATGSRQLIKQYGLRVLIIITGFGRKFDPAAFFTNIGAGIGLLAVATLVADFVAVNLLGQRALYERAKFKQVEVHKDGRTKGLSFSVSQRPAGQTNGGSMDGTVAVVPNETEMAPVTRMAGQTNGGTSSAYQSRRESKNGHSVIGNGSTGRSPTGVQDSHVVASPMQPSDVNGSNGNGHHSAFLAAEPDEPEEDWAKQSFKDGSV